MNFRKTILAGVLFSLAAAALASPYDNLAYALRQKKIIDDLRSHCQIDTAIPDAKIKTTFLHDKQTEPHILTAAAALRNKNFKAYERSIKDVQCPEPN
ncbi:YicS family protein [Erwinia sp.]|uniref:YicS family protein n=1 Tax=Erwinia citreus TaxID=558 RepID=UPI003C75D2E4